MAERVHAAGDAAGAMKLLAEAIAAACGCLTAPRTEIELLVRALVAVRHTELQKVQAVGSAARNSRILQRMQVSHFLTPFFHEGAAGLAILSARLPWHHMCLHEHRRCVDTAVDMCSCPDDETGGLQRL